MTAKTAPEPRAIDEPEELRGDVRLRYIRLARKFAEIANSADSLEDGIAGAVECFGRTLGWPLGHAYVQAAAGSDQYIDSGVWWIESEVPCREFVEASAAVPVEPGRGLVGRVVQTGEAQWADDEVVRTLDGRADAARRAALRCGVAFPILVHARVAGVLEFYTHDRRRCEPELVAVLVQLGTELGRVVEREEFERALARTSREERRRVGRELHDSLSQELTGIGMLARSLERKLEDERHDERERARELVASIQEARRQLRAISRGLNPVDVDAGSLGHAIEEFAADTAKAFGVRCRFVEQAPLAVEDDFTANQLFAIVREAVHNAAKHAGAHLVSIEMAARPDRGVELHVRDDGEGFDAASMARTGMGLRTLRYRARLIGARLHIESRPGAGTSIVCSLKRGGDS